ncbi:hypothetical protein HPB47_015523 [Ixodes persulcatus]|uniref:Uncharacterized protein n=1 Tax=Ixodes persulcatus TaxID=34615 RepID=A0AC60QWW5_IXOPE|nr:hypothetical protein HPB47_015523 [Ixodes persulcatus]
MEQHYKSAARYRLPNNGWPKAHTFCQVGRRFYDLVLPSKEQVVVLNVQVVGQRIGLSEAHHLKVAKYSVPEVIDQGGLVCFLTHQRMTTVVPPRAMARSAQ